MQEYDRPGREMDRQNSKESYKDYDYKEKRSESDRKSIDMSLENSSRTSAADKLTEVFERKSIGLMEPFATENPPLIHAPERRLSPPTNVSLRDSSERDFGQTPWAEVTQDSNETLPKPSFDKHSNYPNECNDNLKETNELSRSEIDDAKAIPQPVMQPVQSTTPISNIPSTPNTGSQNIHKYNNNLHQNFNHSNQHQIQNVVAVQPMSITNQSQPLAFSENQSLSKPIIQNISKPIVNLNEQNNSSIAQSQIQSSSELLPQQNVIKPIYLSQKSEKELSESESIASKSSTDPSCLIGNKNSEIHSSESLPVGPDAQKNINTDDKRSDRLSNDQLNKIPNKDPIERKSSGSGSEKKGRGYGGYAVYGRGWGTRESRGRRSHRSSRSNNRASESDGSTDGAPNQERKERRRAPRSPRGPKKTDRVDDTGHTVSVEQIPSQTDGLENREPFAPRGQPSRRGRGGFQGSTRPPAPAKRVAGYGPPNTKSPFSHVNRAVKENEENKDNAQLDDKQKGNHNKLRTASSTGRSEGRGRDRRPKGIGPPSGEDENWETTSEHSESGGAGGGRRSAGSRHPGSQSKGQGSRNHNTGNRQHNSRNTQGGKKDSNGENRTGDITEGISDLKVSNKKDDDGVDDGFQEVRNKRNTKETRGPQGKEEPQHPKQRSHSNQGGARNGSSSRNPSDKAPNNRSSAPVTGKTGSQYDRPRQPNLAPRFVKQRQKQQLGLVPGFGPDAAAPPPPSVNAWDKPISQTLRANVEEPTDIIENKSGHSSQRSTPGDLQTEPKAPVSCSLSTDKAGVLDGTTPPVETIIFENTNYKSAPPAEALKQKYQPAANAAKPQGDEMPSEVEARTLTFNGDVRQPPRSIQEIIAENGRSGSDNDAALGLQINFEANQKGEDSSDMKLDFAFDSDLSQLTEDKTAKSLGLPRTTHSMSTSNTISPLAADLNLKIASVKKVWEMPAVVEGSEELQFAGFEEGTAETSAPPNVCKVKPTQQLQSPPPQHYNHMGYQGGYGGLNVPSPPAVMFNSSQQLLGSSQQLQQQGGLYGAFLDQNRGQFGAFPGSPYGAGSGAPYNYQPPPDMFQSQFRMVRRRIYCI